MQRLPFLLLLATAVGAAACAGDTPAEVINKAPEFPVTATWNAAATPVGTSTVSGALTIQQHLGSRMDASFSITGAPSSTTYQWRIFSGTCADSVPVSDTVPSGIKLFATVQSYPDITVDASGTGSAAPTIAGYLDSLTAYSVRVRPSQKSTNWDGTKPIACGDMQRTPAG